MGKLLKTVSLEPGNDVPLLQRGDKGVNRRKEGTTIAFVGRSHKKETPFTTSVGKPCHSGERKTFNNRKGTNLLSGRKDTRWCR